MTWRTVAWTSECIATVRAALSGSSVTSPTRRIRSSTSATWLSSAGVPVAWRPQMKSHAARLVSTAAGMPPDSSSATSARAGRARPAGAVESARSSEIDQVAATMPA